MPTYEARFRENWYPPAHQQALERAIRRVPTNLNGAIIEVGCFNGQSTVLLATWFEHVLAVDPWGDQSRGADRPDPGSASVYSRFVENTKRLPVIRFRCGWEQFFAIFDGSIAFLHIDAVHEEEHVRGNIAAALPYAQTGTVFCGHDYTSQWPGVQAAVDEAFPERAVDEWVWSYQFS